MIRNEAVAGQFYPGTKNSLLREIESLIDSRAARSDAVGVVSPHAGYAYSGSVAGSVLSHVSMKDDYIIMGPNHTGLGEPFSIDTSDAWKTPMGDIALNGVLREALLSSSRIFRADRLAHLHEHSIEVQLPFLQVLQQGFRFVPIVVASTDIDELRRAGTDIARTVKSLGLSGNLTLIASSDMTHYESHETAKRKDAQAIEAVLDLDEELLLKRVREMDISMCGASPTAVMIVAAKALGAKKGSLVRYQTSGDTSGDYSSVVGYAGIIIK